MSWEKKKNFPLFWKMVFEFKEIFRFIPLKCLEKFNDKLKD